ncbi:MAG: pilus assembly protein PilP [Deltaproteobacteria bacterium]|nr:pilus assembly protein PilP [Deltaproteobacteria bacterium]
MRRHFISVVTGGIMVLLLVGGTGIRAADSKTSPQAGGSDILSGKPVPAAAVMAAPAYSYQPAGKTDPFKPFMETDLAVKTQKQQEVKKKAVVETGPISPLQKLETGQYRLVGIAGDQKKCVAIVEDGTAKRYYPLFVGTFIGLNDGRVAAILPDRVIVEEKTDKQAKRAKIRRVTMMLHKDEEGKP